MPFPSRSEAVFKALCPRCRRGAFFSHKPLNLKHMLDIHENCPKCGIKYEVEPGFFWGAMYVNYAFNLATMMIVGLLVYLSGTTNIWVYIGAILTAVVLTIPFTARASRVLLLHFVSGIRFEG